MKLDSISNIYTNSPAPGKHNLVIGEVGARAAPEFKALTLFAKLLQTPANKDSIMSEVGYS